MKYFLIYLFLEVMVSTTIASAIGGFMTFIEIIATAIIGIFMLQNFKYSLSSNIKDLMQGEIAQDEFMQRNLGNALGAILLIIPGFFTDILGVLLQFGVLTMIIGKIFSFKPTNTQNYYESQFTNYTRKEDDEIIDVEVIDKHSSIK